jgi:hypothetical protein
VLEHDLVPALAVHLVGGDVEVEELRFLLREPVLLEEDGVLLAIDRRHLRFQADHEGGGGDGEVLADGHRVAPSLQPARDGGGVVDVHHPLARRAGRLGEADEQIGVADVGQLLLVHVLQQEVLRVHRVRRGVRVDVPEVVREGADVVVVVLDPAGEVVPFELSVRPGEGEGGVLRLTTLDGVLQRHTELGCVEQFGHGSPPGPFAVLYVVYDPLA